MNKISLFVIAAVMAVFAFMGAEIYSANASVKSLTADVKLLSAEKATVQAEVNRLSDELELADDALSIALAERKTVTELHKQQLEKQKQLSDELQLAKNQVNTLRQSHDEYIKNWANAPVPVAAVRLLKWAEPIAGDYPDGSTESASVLNAASITNHRLSTAIAF